MLWKAEKRVIKKFLNSKRIWRHDVSVFKFVFSMCPCFSYRQFIFFFQKALYYFSGKIFFRRTEAVAWRCSVKSTSNVSCKVHSKIPVSDSFLSVKFEDRDLKNSIRYRCFLVNFEKVLRISERRSYSSYYPNCLPAEKVFTLVFY